MASKEAEYLNQVFASIPADPEGAPHDYAAERREGRKRPQPEVPADVTIEEFTLAGIHGEIIRNSKKTDLDDHTIFYIHGGGFTTGTASERRAITTYLADQYGWTVVSNDYRLAPEHKWPDGPEDSFTYYRCLLGEGFDPAKMVLMGESAGATSVLYVSQRAREEHLPQPAALVVFSPATNTAEHFPSHSKNIPTDTMLKDSLMRPGQNEALFTSQDPEYLKDPLISPYYADFTGLPPVFLAASDNEVLLDDAVLLYRKLEEAGHPAELDVQKGVFHAYPMLPVVPEARETIDKAMKFAEKYL